MRADEEASTLIIGSGFAGALVARELVARGHPCTILERGAAVPWAEQLETGRWEAEGPTTERNHESGPDGLDWPWTYVYGVGGTSNRWAGTSPRFLPEDFEMRTRYGVMRDWPFGYDELLPYYRAAEEVLGTAGPDTELMPGGPYAQPPHPLSPQDEIVKPLLEPFIALPQCRPTRPVGGSPACCASTRCQLCPVDAKATVSNRLGDVLRSPDVRLHTETVATQLVSDRRGRAIVAVESVKADGTELRFRPRRVVVAANGIESPGLLLRSGIGDGDTGRFLFDHRNAKLLLETGVPVAPGSGASLITGASYAYYGGPRDRRAAALLLPYNPGAPRDRVFASLVDGLVAGRGGPALRRRIEADWRRRLAFDVYLDDMPDAANTVTLSSRRDRFGVPLNRVRFGEPTSYQREAVRHLREDVPRRLRSLRPREATFEYVPQGGHLLGTLRMGDDERAVLDRDLRHRARENLFVSGGAAFPTYSPAHPTLTIAALAVRLGRMLAAEA